MSRPIELHDYVPVRDRIREFYLRYPKGSIRTEAVRLDGGRVVFKAMAYRDPADRYPTTGWAAESAVAGSTDDAVLVARCETAAVGRALGNLDIAARPRPSREEMEKVVRSRRARRRGVDARRRGA